MSMTARERLRLALEGFFSGGSVRARVARGTFWSMVSSVSQQTLGLVSMILTARILGKAGFGELGMLRSTILMFGVLAGTGLGMAVTKFVAEYRDIDPDRAGRIIGVLLKMAALGGGGATLLCLGLAAPLTAAVMKAGHLAGPLRIGSILLILSTMSGVQVGAIAGFEAFKRLAQVNALEAVGNVIFIPLGAWFFGLSGAMGGNVAAALMAFPFKQWALGRESRRAGVVVSGAPVPGVVRVFFAFILPAILLSVVIQPFEWFARLLLARQHNGYAELGIFTAAWTFGQLILFLPSQISGPIMPIFANLLSLKKFKQLRDMAIIAQVMIVFLAVVTSVPLLIFPDLFLNTFGHGFSHGHDAFVFLTLAYMICSSTLITRAFFLATGRMWLQTLQTLGWGGLLVLFSYLFQSGSHGLAKSYLYAYIVFTLLQIGTQYYFICKSRS